MRQTINGADLRRLIISAAASIEINKQALNELNVFPVPDGDTGTNMSMTMNAAATELNLPDLAAFALETICQGQPNAKKHMHQLANHYIKNEQFSEAADAYRRVLKVDPTDPIAMRGEKDCSARATMKQGNWEGKGDFRTKMKNATATTDLESADKMGLTRAEMEQRLAQLSEQYAVDNTNLQVVKDIASIYEQMEDYANAYSFYAYAYQLGGSADVALNDKAMAMHEKAMQAEITYYEQVLAAVSDYEKGNMRLSVVLASLEAK